jgi:hypothetical protein
MVFELGDLPFHWGGLRESSPEENLSYSIKSEWDQLEDGLLWGLVLGSYCRIDRSFHKDSRHPLG